MSHNKTKSQQVNQKNQQKSKSRNLTPILTCIFVGKYCKMCNVKNATAEVRGFLSDTNYERPEVHDRRQFTAPRLSDYLKRSSELGKKKRQQLYIRKFESGNYFTNCNLVDIEISNSRFKKVSFNDSHLIRMSFHKVIFQECSFIGTKIESVNFNSTGFENCTFDKASFLQIKNMDGSWFQSCSMQEISMQCEPNLKRCRFYNNDFQGARLNKISFFKGLGQDGKFQGAYLQGAYLAGDDNIIFNTSLKNAKLQNAKIEWAEVCWVDFSEADMIGMKIFNPEFAMVNFTDAIGLTYEMFETVRTMHEIIGLPQEIENRLRIERPEIWKEPSWYANRIKGRENLLKF